MVSSAGIPGTGQQLSTSRLKVLLGRMKIMCMNGQGPAQIFNSVVSPIRLYFVITLPTILNCWHWFPREMAYQSQQKLAQGPQDMLS